MKLTVGDTITVTAGKDKGKTGKITKVLPTKAKVIVEGINKYKRHIRRQNDQNQGGIVEIERALPVSNVQIVCGTCNKLTRIAYEIAKTGEKQRVCAKCHAPIAGKKAK